MPGNLYIVATPIGNSEDITDRAKRTLRKADIVAAEDTRTTQKLFSMLGIQNKMVSNHKFNEKQQAAHLISALLDGKNVAIVSDAGTPCISDPGHTVVRGAVSNGIPVLSVCGASSVTAALSISGFPLASFAFYGFFPRESNAIREALRGLKDSDIKVSVFFESPRRILRLLQLIEEELPGAELCLCNDLTKLHERLYRGTPGAVLAELRLNPACEKGEYTLVMDTSAQPKAAPAESQSHESLLMDYVVKNGGTVKSAVEALQAKYRRQISKKEFYAAALRLKELLPRLFPSGDAGDPAVAEHRG